jgi:hypothetical protein
MSPLELAPFARESLRRTRTTQLALAAILGGLGALVLGILTAVTLSGGARPEDGVEIIGGFTFVVTALPTALLLRAGWAHESRHVLVRVLEQHPEKVRRVSFSSESRGGAQVRVAIVETTESLTYTFEVPPEEVLARAPKRVARSGRAMTSFSGDFVPLPSAWAGLEGAGAIEVTEAALVVSGSRRRTRLATILGVILGACAGLLTIVFFVWVDLPWIDDPRLPAVLAIVAAVTAHAGASALLARALPRTRVRLEVPWLCVLDVRPAGAFVDLQSVHPALSGLSRFRTDRAEVLVAQCRGD